MSPRHIAPCDAKHRATGDAKKASAVRCPPPPPAAAAHVTGASLNMPGTKGLADTMQSLGQQLVARRVSSKMVGTTWRNRAQSATESNYGGNTREDQLSIARRIATKMEDDTDLELRARVLKEVEEEDEDVSYDVLFLRECDVPEPHAAATHHEINGKGLSGQMHRTDTFKKPQRRNSQVGLGGNTKCVSHSLGSVTTMSTIGRRKSEAARTMRVVSARERLRAQGKAVVAAASVVSFM